MVHTENLSMPSAENLASGKTISSSRKHPHTSPQAQKVSLDLGNSEDNISLDLVEIRLKPNIPNAMIEHLDREEILTKMTNFNETCKMLENREMNPEKQESFPLSEVKRPQNSKMKKIPIRRTKKRKTRSQYNHFQKVLNWT